MNRFRIWSGLFIRLIRRFWFFWIWIIPWRCLKTLFSDKCEEFLPSLFPGEWKAHPEHLAFFDCQNRWPVSSASTKMARTRKHRRQVRPSQVSLSLCSSPRFRVFHVRFRPYFFFEKLIKFVTYFNKSCWSEICIFVFQLTIKSETSFIFIFAQIWSYLKDLNNWLFKKLPDKRTLQRVELGGTQTSCSKFATGHLYCAELYILLHVW